MMMFLGSLLGLAILWMYGMCFQVESVCSYDKNVSQNRTLAICSFTFGIVGILTAGIGICLIRKYGSVFGFVMNIGGRQGFDDYYGGCRRTSNSNDRRGSDVLNQLRQQNEIFQQEVERQRQQQQQFGPFVPPQEYTNLAFVPPELPPYSPWDADGNTISPYDPPPYSAKDALNEKKS